MRHRSRHCTVMSLLSSYYGRKECFGGIWRPRDLEAKGFGGLGIWRGFEGFAGLNGDDSNGDDSNGADWRSSASRSKMSAVTRQSAAPELPCISDSRQIAHGVTAADYFG